jgi:hypothetical protein
LGDIDAEDRTYWIFGGNVARRFHLDTYVMDNLDASVSGCATPKGTPGPGFTYNPSQHLFTAWTGGATVYLFNGRDTAVTTANYGTIPALTCVAVTPPGTAPPVPPAAGTNGRFRFAGNVNGQDIYLLCPQMNSNCFVLVLDGGASTQGHQTFAQRVAGAGRVVYSSSLDTSSLVTAGAIPSSGDGVTVPVVDLTVAPSGDGVNGAMRFTTLAVATGADMSGSWRTGAWSATFGPGTHPGLTPRVRYQFRLFENVAETTFNWAGPNFNNAGQKVDIFHFAGSTCNTIELTHQDNFARGFPQMYKSCGQAFNVTVGTDSLLTQGSPVDTTATVTGQRYNCHNQNKTLTGCPWTHSPHGYSAGWQTIYCDVQFLGEWGTANNAHIRCWFAYDKGTTQPDGAISDGVLRPFIDYTTSLDCNSTPGCQATSSNEGYNAIDFTMYETSGAPAGAPSNAQRWYSGLIVSKDPIPAPDGPTPQ